MTQVLILVPFISINIFFFFIYLLFLFFSTKAGQDVYEQLHTLKPDYSNQLSVPRLQFIISPLSQRLLLQLFTLQTSPLTSHQPNESAGDNSEQGWCDELMGCLPRKMTPTKQQGPARAQRALTAANKQDSLV